MGFIDTEALIAPQIHQKLQNKLQRPLVQCMQEILQEEASPNITNCPPNKGTICYMCEKLYNNACTEHCIKTFVCTQCI